jgi:hypothetical protein
VILNDVGAERVGRFDPSPPRSSCHAAGAAPLQVAEGTGKFSDVARDDEEAGERRIAISGGGLSRAAADTIYARNGRYGSDGSWGHGRRKAAATSLHLERTLGRIFRAGGGRAISAKLSSHAHAALHGVQRTGRARRASRGASADMPGGCHWRRRAAPPQGNGMPLRPGVARDFATKSLCSHRRWPMGALGRP